MKSLSSTSIFFAILLVSASAFASWPDLSSPAGVEASGANDVALIVSIEDYAFLPDVAGASQNAADWERFLRTELGVPTVLVLKDQQAVREEILDFAKRAASASSEDGRVWLVFIGHGAPNKSGDDGLLIGADGQQTMSSMMARSVSRSELLDVIGEGKQADTIAVIDACFSGRDPEGNALAKGVQPVLPVNAVLATPQRTAVLTAASANEVAGQLPDAERPAFSYLVLGAMRGWGDDGDGVVTAREATDFARSELLGVSGRRQTPQLAGTDSLALTRGATEARPNRSSGGAVANTNVATPDGGSVGATTAPAPATEPGVATNPAYFLLGIGASSPALAGVSFLASADMGIKLNVMLDLETEWRLGIHAAYFSVTDPDAPGIGDTVPFDNGSSITIDAGDTVNDTSEQTLKFGVGPGIAFRGASSVAYIDSSVGLARGVAGGCSSWSATTGASGREVNCSTPTNESAAYVGLRGGMQFGWVDVAAHADLMFGDAGFMLGATVGFAYDR